MSASPASYFHPASLAQRFERDINDAFVEKRIDAQEKRWLEQLHMPVSQHGLSAAAPRVDRLITEDGVPTVAEMAGALLFSDPAASGDGRIYLSTLMYGLEGFNDRTQLQTRLNELMPLRPADRPAFEYERVEGGSFSRLMLWIVDQQADHLLALSLHLQQVPSLRQAMRRALEQRFLAVFPGQPADITQARVQVLKDDPKGVNEVGRSNLIKVQSALQVMAEVLTEEKLPPGQRRTWCSATGETLNPQSVGLCEKAVTDAITDLKECYEAMIGRHWLDTYQGLTCRERVAAAMTEALRQQLLARYQDGLLSAAHFQRLGALVGSPPKEQRGGAPVLVQRLCVQGAEGQWLKLVCPLLIELESSGATSLLLYSPLKGLRFYPDLQSLERYFLTAEGMPELKRYLSLDDQALLPAKGALQLKAYAMDRRWAHEQVDAVIGLQKRNLSVALAQGLNAVSRLGATIDDALDVRALIDGRLMHVEGGGRWFDEPTHAVESDPLADAGSNTSTASAPDSSVAVPAPAEASWMAQLRSMEGQLQTVLEAGPDVATCARHALNRYLGVLLLAPPDAQLIEIRWPDASSRLAATAPHGQRVGLVDALVERLGNPQPDALPDNAVFFDITSGAQPARLEGLRPDTVEHVLVRITRDFFDIYVQRLERLYTRLVRLRNAQLDLGSEQWGFHWRLMHLDGDIQNRLETIDLPRLQMLRQALASPERSLRQPTGLDMTEVYSLSLRHAPSSTGAPLADALVFCQPGRPEKGVLFWSALRGLEADGSLALLERRLNARLLSAHTREQWLGLLAKEDQAPVSARLAQWDQPGLSLDAQRIEGDFLHALQTTEEHRRLSDLQWALSFARHSRLPAAALAEFIQQAQGRERGVPALGVLFNAAQASLFEAQLPKWLSDASLLDLLTYGVVFRRYYQSNTLSADFMAGIASIKSFARDMLVKQLETDFPNLSLSPDTIQVTATRYLAAPVPPGSTPSSVAAATIVNRESLTAFALNHFSDIQGAMLSVTLPAGVLGSTRITPRYVDALVRRLDVSKHYQAVLESTLDPKNPGYAVRRQRFVEQMPSRLLLSALAMKLQHQLSQTAFDYLENLMDMPDSLARQPVHGQDITLRPLQLVPALDLAPDTARGMYVIGPKDIQQGPVILHTLFNDAFSFKEYGSQAALLEDLRSNGQLQTVVLDRLDARLRARYDHGGFTEAHIPFSTEGFFDIPLTAPAQVQLASNPQSGNVLHFLFDETVDALKEMSRKQSVTTARADWQSFVHLMSLGAEQILTLLPGKIGLVIAAWQSQSLFKAFASAAFDQDWGKAVAEFSAALGVLISFRRSLEVDEAQGSAAVDEPVEKKPAAQQFSWRNSLVTPELKTRLRTFEARDVALRDLQKDELFNLYQDPVTLDKYAAVAGQVYRVELFKDRWFIVGAQGRGPRIKLDANQMWALDLDWGLRGGGGLISRYHSSVTDLEVDDILLVEAKGIQQIRRLYYARAVMIGDARQQAVRYIEDCLFNLTLSNAQAGLDPRVLGLLADFFGVQTPSPGLIEAIRKTVTELYVGITDPSLSAFSSRRYVVGTNKPGYESTMAFVIKADPKKRIYFTERFFDTPPFRLVSQGPQGSGFNLGNHYRASSLIHELSHLVNDTHDIAYLESSAPFLDLMADPLSPDDTLRADIEHLQTRMLSHRADPADLFVRFDKSLWRDLNDWDGNGKNAVLQITGQNTLEQARTVFLNDAEKRSQIILSNADSVALLVCALGRTRFT